MFWTDQGGSTSTPAPGNAFCRTYTGLVPGQHYRYSYKSYNLSASAAAQLQIKLDGNNLGSVTMASTADWQTTMVTFTATATSADICIYDNNGGTGGNDFALDDIVLETYSFQSCTTTTPVYYPLVNGSNSLDPNSIYTTAGSTAPFGLALLIDNDLTGNSAYMSNGNSLVVGAQDPNSAGMANIDFPAGYFAGYLLDKVSGVSPITATNVTITTYLNGAVQETLAATTVLAGPNSSTQYIGAYTTNKFDGIKMVLSGTAGGFNAYYAAAAPPVCQLVTISGKVFNDTNGLTDDKVNGTGTNPGGLNAVLIGSDGKVVATATVQPDGSYSFANIPAGVSYSIAITTNSATVGQPAPAVTLTPRWGSTGEK